MHCAEVTGKAGFEPAVAILTGWCLTSLATCLESFIRNRALCSRYQDALLKPVVAEA